MVRAVHRARPRAVLVAVATCVLLSGCSSMERADVEEVAATFEDPAADPETLCGLLAPATLAAFEQDEDASCDEAIQKIPLGGAGEIESVEIWGGDAQVRFSGDVLFLTQTRAGWRITAAACESRGEAPYDCGVEGP